jgi:hypothetical protein
MIASDNLTFTRPAAELPADSPEIAALAGHLRAGRCALFVGAGLSVPAKLPTWGELMDRLIVESTERAVDPGLFAEDISLDDSPAVAMREPQVEAR